MIGQIPEQIYLTPFYYSQEDEPWASKIYSNPQMNDKSQTMAKTGCGPTSMAIIVRTITGKNVTPYDMACLSVVNGYRTDHDGTASGFYEFIANKYGFACNETTNVEQVKTALKDKKHIVIASMSSGHFTEVGHLMVLTGVVNEDNTDWFEVYDPNRQNTNYDKYRDSAVKLTDDTGFNGIVKAKTSIVNQERYTYWIFSRSRTLGIDINAPDGFLTHPTDDVPVWKALGLTLTAVTRRKI